MSFLPVKYNFTIWKDATFKKRILTYQGDVGSALRNLTGCSAVLQIKNVPNGTVLTTLSTANNRIVLGGSAGTIDLIITAVDTNLLSWTVGVYDLLLTNVDTSVDALLTGQFSVKGV